ncbi:hypothetical protein, partial [Vibrio genomosp. F6]|uniref:hypothetical protein n=1 Tax=Vibrio genomosp. F6 TaxID=723172 RepID=UPI000A04F0B1
PLGNPSRGISYFFIRSKLKECFPNSSLKCGAHHSKLVKAVKDFSYDFELNAAFLGKEAGKCAFCLLRQRYLYGVIEIDVSISLVLLHFIYRLYIP